MPQAPTVPGLVPTIAPQGSIPNIDLGVPTDAFGGAVGKALEGLGSAVEQGSGQIWQRAMELQDIQNRAEVDKSDAEYMKQAGLEHAKFSAMQGAQASAYFPQYIQNLQSIRENIRGGMSNPASQRMFDSTSLSTFGRTVFNGAGHAATEAHQDAISSINGRIQALTDAAAASEDPAFVEKTKGTIRALSIVKDRDLQGVSDPVALQEGAKKATSSLDYNVIEFTAKTDPWTAQKMFDERKTGMTDDDQKRAQNVITAQGRVIGGPNIAKRVIDANRDQDGNITATYKQLESQVEDKSKEFAPKDPVVAQYAKNALEHQTNQEKFAQRQEKAENFSAIDSAVMAGAKNFQEVMADPNASRAFKNLTETEKLQAYGRVNRYIASRDKQYNDEQMTQFAGLRLRDKDTFVQIDPTDPKYRLSQENQAKIFNAQRAILDKKPATNDPNVWSALATLRGSMGDSLRGLGVYKADPNNPDDFDHFMGSLQKNLEVWQDNHGGKKPDAKAINEEIGPQVIKNVTVPGRFYGTNQVPAFNQPVPDNFTNRYKKEVNPQASDEEIRRNFYRSEAMRLYKKPSPNAE